MIFPLPAGLSLNLAAHVVFGSWGMYRFMRKREVGEMGSMLGALGFGLMPKLAAHFGAGHVSLIYAISWMMLFWKSCWIITVVTLSCRQIFLPMPNLQMYPAMFS